jgi:hypothetical protein
MKQILRLLGLDMGKFMNWKTHVKLMLHKLGNACFTVWKTKYCSNIETLGMTYHCIFLLSYEVWDNFLG